MANPVTIYLVDGDRSARKGLANLLKAAGHNVEMFSLLDDFFQIKNKEDYACLLMDVWASDLSGTDLKSAFSQKKITIPILFLSARDDRISRKKAIKAGGAAFFRKPIDGPALLDAINWEVESHQQNNIKRES